MITRPLLAGKLETEEDFKTLNYPLIATPKLDGIRVLKINGKVVTRTFKELPNRYVRTKLEEILPDNIDGEVMLQEHNTFNDIQSQIMSFDGEPDFTFHAFDYIKDDLDKPYKDRLDDLFSVITEINSLNTDLSNRIIAVNPQYINNLSELLEFDNYCINNNFEGIMIRTPNSRYKCGRSTMKEQILLKIKKFVDSEAKILGFVEKLTNTNEKTKDEFGLSKRSSKKEGLVPANTLGAVEVMDIHSGVTFEVGSGFDDKLKLEIWNNKDFYLNKIIKYKSQPFGQKDKPRIPVFLSFRHEDDIIVEK